MKKRHFHWSDLHGYSRLVIDATLGITDLVEAMHLNLLHLPAPFGKAHAARAQRSHGAVRKVVHKTTGLMYGSIRRATHLVAGGLDRALGRLQPEIAHLHSTKEREALISILNGVLGDHMTRHSNPLTITMGWRLAGKNLSLTQEALASALPHATGRILVMLHGHCMNELQWTTSSGHNHGEVLAGANGYTPMALRYNSGLHISQNGRALAEQLELLVNAWPVPVQEINVVGYSMGGLLARSALHYGALAHHRWPGSVRKLVFVGTPHHGSMLEQAGNLVGDGLVPLKSALGQHHERQRALHFAPGHQKVFYGMTHLGLLDSKAVCQQMQQWLGERA